MFCSNCGNKLIEDADYCSACGQKIERKNNNEIPNKIIDINETNLSENIEIEQGEADILEHEQLLDDITPSEIEAVKLHMENQEQALEQAVKKIEQIQEKQRLYEEVLADVLQAMQKINR